MFKLVWYAKNNKKDVNSLKSDRLLWEQSDKEYTLVSFFPNTYEYNAIVAIDITFTGIRMIYPRVRNKLV